MKTYSLDLFIRLKKKYWSEGGADQERKVEGNQVLVYMKI